MNWTGAVSYATAAAAFMILAAVLIAGWRGRSVGARVIAASLVSAVWAAAVAIDFWHRGRDVTAPTILEWLRDAAWLFALGGMLRTAGFARLFEWTAYGFAASAVILAAARLAGLGIATGPGWASQASLVSATVLPVIGLVLLEQVHRSTHATGRRATWPLYVGLGGMFVFDLFMYSDTMLTVSVSPDALVARGLVAAVCVPAIALAARRNPDWSLDVFVSRQVVLYMTTFLVVGAYLIAMAGGGYLVRALGGQWGAVAQLVFLCGAALVLAMLVASNSARLRLKVFLNKHFYHNKYDYRSEWLRFVKALETSAPDAQARPAIIGAVAQVVGSRFGALWIRSDDDQRLIPATQWGDDGAGRVEFASIDVKSEFVEFLERRQWIVDLAEYRRTPEVYENLRLPETIAAQSQLALFVPLTHAGKLVGLMGLAAPDAPFEINFEDRDLLKTVASNVGTHIAQFESDRRLTEARQFEAYSRLTAFVMHDLKNLVAQLSLVVANAEKHRRNPAFVDDAIDTIRNSTDRMTRLIEQLQRGETRSAGRSVALRSVLERVVERAADRQPPPTLECTIADLTVNADPDRLATAIEHIVRNGQDATDAGGSVSVRLSKDGDRAVIQVADSGAGMSQTFIRERLFRPFDSTKGSKGMGIGAYQVRDYVRSLRGEVAVTSAPGAGTVFAITLPIAPTDQEP